MRQEWAATIVLPELGRPSQASKGGQEEEPSPVYHVSFDDQRSDSLPVRRVLKETVDIHLGAEIALVRPVLEPELG